MRDRRRIATVIWLILAGLLIAACSGDSAPGPDEAAGAVDASVDEGEPAEDAPASDPVVIDGYGSQLPQSDGQTGAEREHEGVAGLSEQQPADENPDESDAIPIPASPTLRGLLISSTEQKVTPGDPESNDEFGWSLGIGGHTLASGAPLSDDKGGNSGTAYVFNWDGTRWLQAAKLVAEDGSERDWFGKSAAVWGDYVVIGANLDDGPLRNGFFDDDTGSAYVFVREQGPAGEFWRQQAKLRSDLQIEWAEFGFAVEIEDDVIAVAAYHDPTAGFDTGAVYIFRRNGEEWVQEAQLLPSNANPADEFGIDIALDGDTLLVGAARDDELGDDAGAAYVFRYRDGEWREEAVLRPPTAARFDSFGWSVDLYGDVAIVGAPFAELSEEQADSGLAYLFEREGSTWTLAQQLAPADPFPGAWFGRAVGIAGDYAVVGAPRYDQITLDGEANELFNIGVSYLFRRSEDGWTEVAQLRADDAGEGDDFGWTIAMTPEIALIGAWLDDTEDGVDTGSFYSYRLLAGEGVLSGDS